MRQPLSVVSRVTGRAPLRPRFSISSMNGVSRFSMSARNLFE
jgi:hypothetical protein